MSSNESLNWLCDYLKGLKTISSLTDDIILELTKNFGFIEDEYDSSYNEDNILYRGLFFEDELSFTKFLNSIDSNGFINLKHSSWTEDSIIAQDFMYGKGYDFYNDIKDTTNQKGFSIKISSEIPTDKVICSYLNISEYLENKDINYSKEIELIKNDSEFIIDSGLYKIEIDMATIECREFIEDILGKNHTSVKYIEYSE